MANRGTREADAGSKSNPPFGFEPNPNRERSQARARHERSSESAPATLGPLERTLVLAFALIGFAALTLARALTPDPRGFGTHEALGLAPCRARAISGEPCPSCGATTALAWALRGEPARAVRANPAGALLALSLPTLILWLATLAARGRTLGRHDAPWGFWIAAWVVAHAALALLVWLSRTRIGATEWIP